ncbi:MAG TPA: glycosyltransferase [Planctomycetes bacterium]|nr:glycosyltransferase [Planctomycetota bacterium]
MGGGRAPVRLGVLAAAGAGLRAWPRTEHLPKVLFEVGGRTLLERALERMERELGLEEALVLVGYLGDEVRAFLGERRDAGMPVRCIEVDRPEQGLAAGLLSIRDELTEPFAVLLGDEFHLGADWEKLRGLDPGWDAVLCVLPGADLETLQKNYAVREEEGRVLEVEEKPDVGRVRGGTECGLGTFLLRPSIFGAIERTSPNERTGRVELVDAIGTLASGGAKVRAVPLGGDYVNVNSVEDLNRANYIARSHLFPEARVSLVIPAWNEAESIAAVVDSFRPLVHEVVVADNQSTDGTGEIARAHGARVSSKPLAGYGDALRHGFEVAEGDILVAVEADHSFRAKDLPKLLEYLKDADLVVGTRTTRELIEQGANMRGPVRWANVAFGKGIELLWWNQEPRFTDVGCTYRAIWRDAYERIRPRLRADGPEFAPEMVVEVLREHRRVIEVPVSYHRRLGGASKHSGDLLSLARTASRMLALILRRRFSS